MGRTRILEQRLTSSSILDSMWYTFEDYTTRNSIFGSAIGHPPSSILVALFLLSLSSLMEFCM